MVERNSANKYDEISFIEIVNVVLKGKWIIIAMLVIGLIFGLLLSIYQKSKIEPMSKSNIVLVSSINNKIINDKVTILFKHKEVIEGVKKDLDIESLGSFSINSLNNGLFEITVTNSDAELANEINYALIDNFQEYLENEYTKRYYKQEELVLNIVFSLDSSLGVYEQEIKDSIIASTTDYLASTIDNTYVEILKEPYVTYASVDFNRNIGVGALLFTFFGFVIVFLRLWWQNNREKFLI